MATQLEKLLKKQEQLKAQIASIRAREKKQRRKDETRLKILVGAMTINEAIKNEDIDGLKKKLNEFLERDNDRKVLYILDEQK
jgi:hypothetical protein